HRLRRTERHLKRLRAGAQPPVIVRQAVQRIAARCVRGGVYVGDGPGTQKVVPADQRLVHHLVDVLRNEDRHQALTVRRNPSSANSLICSARLRMVFWSKTSPTMLRCTVRGIGAPPPAAGGCASAMAPPAEPPPERPTPPSG